MAPGETRWRPGDAMALAPAHARYLGAVLRLDAGAIVRVFNGRDGEWRTTIAHVRKDRAELSLAARTRAPADHPPDAGPTLLFAPLKRDATDLVVRMATELGVARLLPVTTHRTNTHRINPDRLQAIAAEASEQCERLDLPVIAPLQNLHEALEAWPADLALFAAIERRTSPDPTGGRVDPRFGVLIGPEGGFSEAELAWLGSLAFLRPLSLGPLVLRADTAACAALGWLQARARAGTE